MMPLPMEYRNASMPVLVCFQCRQRCKRGHDCQCNLLAVPCRHDRNGLHPSHLHLARGNVVSSLELAAEGCGVLEAMLDRDIYDLPVPLRRV